MTVTPRARLRAWLVCYSALRYSCKLRVSTEQRRLSDDKESAKVNTLLPYIRNWFLPKEEYFVAFANADSHIEGWFKAEMIILLNRLRQQGIVDEFQRELNVPTPNGPRQRNQIDFRICLQGQTHLCELKALCISQAAGTPRNLQFYFRDDHLGIIKDLKKLDALPNRDSKWVLGFVYPSPDPANWSRTILSLADDLNHWKCVTKPQDFPRFVFMSLWKQGL